MMRLYDSCASTYLPSAARARARPRTRVGRVHHRVGAPEAVLGGRVVLVLEGLLALLTERARGRAIGVGLGARLGRGRPYRERERRPARGRAARKRMGRQVSPELSASTMGSPAAELRPRGASRASNKTVRAREPHLDGALCREVTGARSSTRERGGIGRRTRFRFWRGNSCKGSSPFVRTRLGLGSRGREDAPLELSEPGTAAKLSALPRRALRTWHRAGAPSSRGRSSERARPSREARSRRPGSHRRRGDRRPSFAEAQLPRGHQAEGHGRPLEAPSRGTAAASLGASAVRASERARGQRAEPGATKTGRPPERPALDSRRDVESVTRCGSGRLGRLRPRAPRPSCGALAVLAEAELARCRRDRARGGPESSTASPLYSCTTKSV